jgi:hypothetical protein
MRRYPVPVLALVLSACSGSQGARRDPAVASVATDSAAPAATASAGTAPAGAQPGAPAAARQASPRDTARGTVGGASVMVDYSRPAKRGRTIFGANGLVPYGRVWRTGANAATTLVTSAPLRVGQTQLPAGTYTLYTLPDANGWQLIVNRQTGQWGTDYDQTQDVARIPMQVTTLQSPAEQFTIAVEPAALVMRWDTVQASAPLSAGGR